MGGRSGPIPPLLVLFDLRASSHFLTTMGTAIVDFSELRSRA